ncbi:hypothetical protein PG994_009953 [Apiospora phragmitis]|uniref:FAD-binding PCMH-type domain-containing protein n=1 Tax=Apiospora phragmitis TaxID=2905665 RepID=A0ABR1TNI3_9PEZI
MTLRVASEAVVSELVRGGLEELLSPAGSTRYDERISSYFSLTAQKKPFCFVHPKTTAKVALILKTLLANPDARFAIRSGGHVMWGASNIDDSICIDLGVHMNYTSVDKEKGIVSIQPGARWREVYKSLELHNVAGLLTGVGISWYIPRVGFCGDQLVKAEVVLADGRVVHANQNNEHADLWRALEGASAGNFGIVTRFDVRALSDDGLWGGMLLSEATAERSADHVATMRRFTDDSERFPDSSYIVLWNYEPSRFRDIVITSFLANTKGVENPPELKQLCDIPTIARDLKQTNMHDFALAMDQPQGTHNFWHTTTFLSDERIMAKAVELHAAAVAQIRAISKMGQFSSLCLFQSLPSHYGRLGDERGGNVMGLDRALKGRNAIMLLLSVNVGGDEEDSVRAVGLEATRESLRGVDAFARSVDGFVDWTYLNYADCSQDPLRSLLDPEEVKRTALKYDPTGVFQTRAPGGFKISAV